ncbi:MAG: hypothetical protein GY753_16965 [Gammaproteobacteria bacterium]|nr:hypothetical protein [Gammaproteobacteria bacterium]
MITRRQRRVKADQLRRAIALLELAILETEEGEITEISQTIDRAQYMIDLVQMLLKDPRRNP